MSTPIAPPTTFLEFASQFATEEACVEYLASWRWPDGFACPKCEGHEAWRHRLRPVWECKTCGRQTSITAGTVLHRTKSDLRVWLYGLWLFGVRHASISALQFQKETGLARYDTAWTILHKVRAALDEPVDHQLRRGTVEMDETSWGGGGRNRGRGLDPMASWLLIAIERIEVAKTNEKTGETTSYRASGSARLSTAKDCSAPTLRAFTEESVAPGARIATDQWGGYRRLAEDGFEHDARKCANRPTVIEEHLPKVHLLISNLKTWLRGTFHGVSDKHLVAYAREYIYRWGRRHLRGGQLFGYVARRLVRCGPTTYRQLVDGAPQATG